MFQKYVIIKEYIKVVLNSKTQVTWDPLYQNYYNSIELDIVPNAGNSITWQYKQLTNYNKNR